jgi:lipoprotein-releasing system permease protein
VWVVARRLILRERVADGRAGRVFWCVLAATIVVGTVMVFAGVRSVVPPLAAGVAALVLFGAACVRTLTPAVAVAVFGMGLGCSALVTVLGVTSGFEHALTSKLARVNGHVLLSEYGQDFDEYGEVIARWRADERVAAASPFAYAMAAVVPVRAEEDVSEDRPSRAPAIALVKGLDPALAAEMPGIAEMLAHGDLSALRPGSWDAAPGVALGHRLARRLGVVPGDRVNLVIPAELDGTAASLGRPPRHATFEVLDLLDTGVTEFDTQLALCHLTAGQALFFGEGRVTGVEFSLHHADDADAIADEMMATHGRDFRATTWRQQSEGTVAGLRQIRGAVALVLGLLEVVAATALIASLLLLVRRKRAEIAALMALGADGRAVFWIFEMVGLLAGAAGAAIGIGLGLLLSALVSAYRYPLSGDVYPVDHLPVRLMAADVLLPGIAAFVLCALVSGPVALVAAKQPLLAGLRRT